MIASGGAFDAPVLSVNLLEQKDGLRIEIRMLITEKRSAKDKLESAAKPNTR